MTFVAYPFQSYAVVVGIGTSISEIAYLRMGKCSAESEISARQWLGIDIIYQTFPVDDIPHPAIDSLKSDAIPMVGFDKMCLVGIFPKDNRAQPLLLLGRPISLVSAEPCSGIPVTAIAHVIEFEGIVVGKLTATATTFVGHPEAVEIAHPRVTFVGCKSRVSNNPCLVFDDGIAAHFMFIPPSCSFWGDNCRYAVLGVSSRSRVFSLQPPISFGIRIYTQCQ